MLGDRLPIPITPKKTSIDSPRPEKPDNLKGANLELSNIEDQTGKPPDSNLEPSKTENNSTGNIKEKKTKKKSPWFNSFYPTYKSRSEDFKRIFKDVPDDERLLVDYSCAVQKEILVHGRLYVTQNYLCFYANIFGWETNIVLKWKDVAAITKEKTVLVIPKAVLISTNTEKYFFTSFVARDKVYLMLFRVWQNALLDKQMSNQEMWKWVHHSYGAELGLTSDDEDYIAPGTEEDKLSSKTPSGTVIEGEDYKNGAKEKMQEEKDNASNGLSTTHSKKSSTEAQEASSDFDNSESDFSDLDIPAQCDNAENIRCTCPHDMRQLVNEILPIHVDQLFTLMFTSSKFFLDFHAARKTTDLVQTPWVQNATDGTKSRVVNQTVNLTQAIGPKSSQVTQTQVILPCSKPGVLYSINSESVSGGVPYGDSFYIDMHYCLRRVSDKQCSFEVFAQVKFKKSVWGLVKSMIEKNCWSGMEEFYDALIKALKVEAEESAPDVKRKIKRRRKLHSIPRTETPVPILGPTLHSKEPPLSVLTSERATLFIFVVLIILLILNVMLYHKLWSLEEEPSIDLLHIQLLKNPPATHDEWSKILKKQEHVYMEEVKKWQESLRSAISSLKQAEDILLNLQQSATSSVINSMRIDEADGMNLNSKN